MVDLPICAWRAEDPFYQKERDSEDYEYELNTGSNSNDLSDL